ncbi:dephospho-CoA kinase [Sneathiella chinensis]|uniref:Dephospho-CoA kinase n=1 Tax=Sneathiella chinensis TaxID=349750 RepID=A0ABQ5TZ97_9PROT|nr:dephospho-CoA kinase [Sneathiella chinensis]GLQ04934.1 dephospho-CoA kinase [Sneathiella chinensis]
MTIKLLGLTGSIGMGKSTVGKMFQSLGIPVYNVDAEIHKLYDRGGIAVAPIQQEFPEAVIDGRVDRPTLSKLVVGNEDAIKRLERIVHPLVGQDRAEFIRDAEESGHSMVVIDVPLIFETGGEKNFHTIIVVSASAPVQRERVLARDDMSAEKFEAILARQLPDAEKRDRAHHVINTDCSEEETFEQVKKLVEELKNA